MPVDYLGGRVVVGGTARGSRVQSPAGHMQFFRISDLCSEVDVRPAFAAGHRRSLFAHSAGSMDLVAVDSSPLACPHIRHSLLHLADAADLCPCAVVAAVAAVEPVPKVAAHPIVPAGHCIVLLDIYHHMRVAGTTIGCSRSRLVCTPAEVLVVLIVEHHNSSYWADSERAVGTPCS